MKAVNIFIILLAIAGLSFPLKVWGKKDGEKKKDKKEVFISNEELLELLLLFEVLENLDLMEQIQFLEDFEVLYFQEVQE